MKISELIAHVGDENVRVQFLDSCIDSIRKQGSGATLITFGTDAISAHEVLTGNSEMMGVVVWIPRDKLPKEIK